MTVDSYRSTSERPLVRGEGLSALMAVRIAVVDPLPIFRHGVVKALEASGHAVETPRDVMAWTQRRPATLVLLTITSEYDWNVLNMLCRSTSSRLVIAVLDSMSALAGVRAVRAGAHSVLARESTLSALQRTVEATIAGQAVMPTTVAAALVESNDKGERIPSAEQISWLRQLANGMTVAQLADRAGYSEREMYRLLRTLYRQMGVRTRLQAVIGAKEAEWI